MWPRCCWNFLFGVPAFFFCSLPYFAKLSLQLRHPCNKVKDFRADTSWLSRFSGEALLQQGSRWVLVAQVGKLDSGFSSVCLYAFRRECSSGTRRSMKPSIRSESRDLYHVVDIVSAHFYTSLFNICHRPRSSALYSSEKDKGLLLPLTTCRRALLRT